MTSRSVLSTRMMIILTAGALLSSLIPVVGLAGLIQTWEPRHRHPTPGHSHLPEDPASILSVAPTLDRSGWQVSAEKADPADALDGDPKTAWESRGARTIIIDLGEPTEVSALLYTPAPDDRPRLVHYDLRVSDNGRHWSDTVSKGVLADDTSVKTLGFAVRSTRYLRLFTPDMAFDVAELNALGRPRVARLPGPDRGSQAGSWGPVLGFPVVPVAAAVLPDNRLVTWSAFASNDYGGDQGFTQTAMFDLGEGEVSGREVAETGHDMFCPGTSLLGDGRLLVTGGGNAEKASTYDLFTDDWEAVGELNRARGYQGQVTLASGEALVVGGRWNSDGDERPGEVFDPGSNSWRELPGVDAETLSTRDPQPHRAADHIWLLPLSGGRLLAAGPSARMHWVDTQGEGGLVKAGERDGRDRMNGNAVMYDRDRILVVGGAAAYDGGPGHAEAHTIDTSGRNLLVQPAGSMRLGRTFTNSVVLPNGQVLVMGGQTEAAPFTDEGAVLEPELWDPVQRSFTPMAPMAVPRTYHSVALLLPDGRVFVGGGGLCGECGTNHADGQIFTPPYLLNPDGSKRVRPVITQAPEQAGHGETITVSTNEEISEFALVRTSSVTHSLNNDQRRIPLRAQPSPSGAAGERSLLLPEDAGVTPPGYYMLFAMNAAGVPSTAKMIRIS